MSSPFGVTSQKKYNAVVIDAAGKMLQESNQYFNIILTEIIHYAMLIPSIIRFETYIVLAAFIITMLLTVHVIIRLSAASKVVTLCVLDFCRAAGSAQRIEGLRIVKSSGYDILDKNTLDTISKACPFPRPPIKAEPVMPVVYKLE